MTLLRRSRIALILLCGAVAFYAILGFFVAPYAIKTYAIPALSERLRHPVVLDDIQINPFTFSLTLTAFEIREPDQTPMLGFQELFVNFEGTSLVRSAYIFDEIRLTLPFGLVHIQPDGKLNLLELVPPAHESPAEPAAPPPDSHTEKAPLPPVEIRTLSIRQGVIEYRDDSTRTPVTIDVVPIEITLRSFGTRRGGEDAYVFSAEFDEGESVTWEGTVHFDPLESDGRVSLSNIKLKTFWPSLRDRFRFDILSGAVGIDARYHFDQKSAPLNLQVTDGKFVLSDFRLSAAGDRDPVLVVPSFVLDSIRMDLPKQEVGIGTVRLTGAEIRTWLAEDGAVNFTSLFAPVAPSQERPAEPKRPAAEPEHPWSVDVQAIQVEKTQVAFEDRRLKTPVQLAFDDLHLTVRGLHVPLKGSLPVSAGFRFNQQGTFESQGTLQLDPLSTTLTMKLAHIGLRPFQPYLDRTMQLEIRDGELELDGELAYRSQHDTGPMLRYTGQAGLNRLHVADRASDKEFLGWTALGLNKVALDVSPTAVTIGEIVWRDPSIRLVTAHDGSMNLSRVLQAPKDAQTQASPPAPAPKPAETGAPKQASGPTPIEVNVVRLSKLSATFVDESITPIVTTGIQGLSGTIKGLSSKQVAKAEVALTGTVDEVAPLKIQGHINPLSGDMFTRLTLLFQGVDLTAVSPYAGKYVGYPITKGKLSLNLMYQVSKQQLIGENKVLVDQLTFGEHTDSPDATSLPVRLAVGLLKDRQGRIDIDMPVRGDLNEPDFHYGRVVLNALGNLITKAAISPFSALEGLVEGNGKDLQFVEFQAGRETVDSSEQRKIESVAKALQERPALRIDVTGIADPIKDREALALQHIAAEVQRRFTQGGTKNMQAVPSPAREFELLSDLYAEKLGKQPTKREELPGGKVVELVLTADELRQQLFPAMTVEDSELRLLAQARAKVVREQLIQQGWLSEERVFLVEAELAPSEGTQIRVRLNLTGS